MISSRNYDVQQTLNVYRLLRWHKTPAESNHQVRHITSQLLKTEVKKTWTGGLCRSIISNHQQAHLQKPDGVDHPALSFSNVTICKKYGSSYNQNSFSKNSLYLIRLFRCSEGYLKSLGKLSAAKKIAVVKPLISCFFFTSRLRNRKFALSRWLNKRKTPLYFPQKRYPQDFQRPASFPGPFFEAVHPDLSL